MNGLFTSVVEAPPMLPKLPDDPEGAVAGAAAAGAAAVQAFGNAAKNLTHFLQSQPPFSDRAHAAAEVVGKLRVPRLVGFDQTVRELAFFPLGGLSLTEILEKRGWTTSAYPDGVAWTHAVLSATEGKAVRISTSDGRLLSAFFCPRAHDHALRELDFHHLANDSLSSSSSAAAAAASSSTAATAAAQQAGHGEHPSSLPPASAVLLLHANAMVGLDMADYAQWYRRQGLHVLVLTLGGYGDSEGTAGELSSYLDADAALRWLRTEGVPGLPLSRIVVHGLSIGGAVAAGLCKGHKALHLTLDQSFVNAKEVATVVASLSFGGGGGDHGGKHTSGTPSSAGGSSGGGTGGGGGGEGEGKHKSNNGNTSNSSSRSDANITNFSLPASLLNLDQHLSAQSSWRWAVNSVVDTSFPIGLKATATDHHPFASSAVTNTTTSVGGSAAEPPAGRQQPRYDNTGAGDGRHSGRRQDRSRGGAGGGGSAQPPLALFLSGLEADVLLETKGIVTVAEYTTDGYDTEAKLRDLNSAAAAAAAASPTSLNTSAPLQQQEESGVASLGGSSERVSGEQRSSGVGSCFVFSSDGDALMPKSFAQRLLSARFDLDSAHHGGGGSGGGDVSGDAVAESPLTSSSSWVPVASHQKWAVLTGGHGVFFGDQARSAAKYRSHLEGLELVAPLPVLSHAIRQAQALKERKASAARTLFLKERAGVVLSRGEERQTAAGQINQKGGLSEVAF